MPHPVGIGLGVLAAGLVTAIIAKEVIENWEDLHTTYEEFADKVEMEHDVRLPRFRTRRGGPVPMSARNEYVPRDTTGQRDDTSRSTRGYTSALSRDDTYRRNEVNAHTHHEFPEHTKRNDDFPSYCVSDFEEDSAFQEAVRASLAVKGDDEWSETWTLTDGSDDGNDGRLI